MKYYAGAFGDVAGFPAWLARTGYTGEDGFEVFCRPGDAPAIWAALSAAGAAGRPGPGRPGRPRYAPA